MGSVSNVRKLTGLLVGVVAVILLQGSLGSPALANDTYEISIRANQIGQDLYFEWDPVPSSAWPAPQAGGPWTSLKYYAWVTPMDAGFTGPYFYCDGSFRRMGEIPPPPTSERSCRISGLEPGRAYNIRVTGWLSNDALHTNAVGSGDIFETGGVTLCCGVPGPPRDVRLLDAEGGNAIAVWSPATELGGSREVQYHVDLGTDLDVCITSDNQCRISGLNFNQQYSISVTTVTSGGRSATVASPPLELIPPTPRAPRKVKATPRGGNVIVSWAAPNLAPGQTIRRYQVFSDPGRMTCSTRKTSCRIGGLESGRAYAFEVVAEDSRGRKVASRFTAPVLIPRPVPVSPPRPDPQPQEPPKPEQQFN